ncbi:methyltransferase family protein [Foetidibacter luteolus]|uniref:methyltransferase family protein n=1 Tax=Foetidibacter luteolus TaxID=2608880 RepID=UPI001A984A6D|nr:isoprenylcysteine carboxylmethyltransferase family protein [Foetidibacter luteolus]
MSQIIPLLFAPALIVRYNNLVVIAANILIWLTQPPVLPGETKANQERDKYSVLLILGISLLCVSSSIIEWAYFNNGNPAFNGWSVLGLALLFGGIAFRAAAVQTLGRHFTATVQIKEDHQLITRGPYAIVRHPSYLGAWLALTGCGVFLHSVLGTLLAVFGMLYAYYIRISVEETALIDTFGEKYKAYQKTKARLIPYIW